MATVAANKIAKFGSVAITETTLTGTADTFVYQTNVPSILLLRNATAGALTPVIDGDGGTTVSVAGVGDVSVASGYQVGSIAAGAVVSINLATITAFLKGTIAITGGTGLVATLLEFIA